MKKNILREENKRKLETKKAKRRGKESQRERKEAILQDSYSLKMQVL